MKHFFRTALILLLISFTAESQQISDLLQIIKKPTVPGSFRAFSKAGNTIYTVGYELGVSSHLSKSTDGGFNWQTVTFPFNPSDNINAVFFLTEQTGYVGGSNGVVYKTSNGGSSWNSVSIAGYTSGINDLFFFSPDTGYAVGGFSGGFNLYKTTDGGTSWTGITNPHTSTLYTMRWEDRNNCMIVGTSSRFIKTTDGGLTWSSPTLPVGATTLYDVMRGDAQTIYAAGTSGRVFKSTDNGVSFSSVTNPAGGAIYSIEFDDADNGFLFGSNGIALRTTNGGTSWEWIPIFTTEVIRGSIKYGNTIIAGAYESNFGISTDNGLTWSNPSSSKRDIYGVFAETPSKITVAGDRGDLFQTTNGGVTWSKSAFMTGNLLYDAYTNGSYIYTAGRNGGYFISSDNGATWVDKTVGSATTRNYKLDFLTPEAGYMVNNEGAVLYTTNRGNNWAPVTTIPATTLYDLDMGNSLTGYASGSGERIFKTTDGVNFTHVNLFTPLEQITGIKMIDSLRGYACGENGAFYETTDGFLTAQLLTDTVALNGRLLHDIAILSSDNIWAVGTNGLLVNRRNGITTIDTTTKLNLLSAYKVSNQELLVTASFGYVFRLTDQTVPVELTSFYAVRNSDGVTLRWSTATETNNRGFSVERKTGNGWEEIGFVNGKGTVTTPSAYMFADISVPSGNVSYRLKQVDYDGTFTYTDAVETDGIIGGFALEQNYPNPFNPETVIRYSVGENISGNPVTLKIYDISGSLVEVLVNEVQPAGKYSVKFNGAGLAGGVYFYKLETGNFSEVRKLTLLK